MAFPIFERIIDILHREKVRYVYLYLSGEPILHPRFYDCLELVGQLRITANIATKLPISLRGDELKRILSRTASPILFEVTIDSLNPASSRIIAPGIEIGIVLKNLSVLSSLAKEHGQLSVTVTTVVNRHNEQELPALGGYFKQRGLRWRAKRIGYYMGSRITPEAEKTIAELVPINPDYASRFWIDRGHVHSSAKRCSFPDPAISADGDVSVCCHDMLFDIKTGNVLSENSLLKVLQSDAYQTARRLGNEMRLSICQGCN